MYRYQMIAQNLHNQIRQGTYLPGEKLPSIRKLCSLHRVSVATVQQALSSLEDARLIEARPKSGFYVRATQPKMPTELPDTPDTIGQPQLVDLHLEATQLLRQCGQAQRLDLGIAFPHREFLPQSNIQKITARTIKTTPNALTDVHFPPGLLKLRHEIAKRLAEINCSVHEADVLVTNGCQEALSLCLRAVTQPGDTVAIETPTFLGILELIEALGLKALEIPTHPHDGISVDALALALEQWPIKACVLVPSFNNPLGSCMPDSHREQLVALANQHDITIIEDDVYGDLQFVANRARPLKSFDHQDRVLYCSSVSKSIAPGLRIGWVASNRYRDKLAHLQAFTSVSTATLSQAVVAEFLGSGAYDRHLRQLRSRYAQQIQRFSAQILALFPPGTRVSQPQGGFILWVQLPENIDAHSLHEQALAQGIGLMPGYLFSPARKYRHCLRVCCAVPWSDSVEQALVQIARMM